MTTRADFVDADFVMSKRALRASWGAISAMTGCPEIELRRKFDTALPPLPAPTVMALSPRQKAEQALMKGGLRRDTAVIVARLWQANGAVISGDDLARGIAGGGAAQDACKAARAEAKERLGLAFRPKGFGLTTDDLVAVSRMIEAWESDQ
ncbi:hypothetical protein [Brevundimonas sp. DWR2-3-1b1]|uniref:hypothetical protein n=1 Tax=unclassified Brevundimonas TaxID=2622653 RepID=UPI003CEF882C